MEDKTLHIIILEDNPDDAELMVSELEREGFTLKWSRVDTEEAFRKALEKKPDLILADYKVPSFDGMSAIKMRQKLAPEIPLIIVSGTIGEALAVECVRSGATDYVLKDKLSRLGPVVKRALDEAKKHRKFKQTEEELRKSEEKYRLLAENSIDCIWMLDARLRFTYLSPSVERILGFKPEQLIGTKLSSHFKKIEFLKVGALAAKAVKNYKTFTHVAFETKMLNSKNEEVDIEISSKVLLNSQGKLIGLQGTTRDITDRKRAEEKIRIMAQAMDTTPDAVVITDMEGIIEYVNPGLLLMGGYKSDEEVIGRNILEYAPPSGKKLLAEEVIPATLKEGIWRGESNTIRKDGSVFPILLSSSIVRNESGQPWKQVGIFNDITDRKLAEEETRRSLREKETLLAEIHHRVKNNMQIISSLLSLQSKDIKDERALSLIKNCEDRIKSMSLIHEKLYLSKDLSQIDFHDYMEDLSARLFQVHRVDSRVVSFSSHIKDAFFNIETAIPLGLITNELISNALKHAFPEGKEGNIAVELTQDTKTDKYTLTVTDNGSGLPEEIDYRNTETFGLQLVDMLAEQLGGTVELDRSKGTSFRIIFKEQKYRRRI